MVLLPQRSVDIARVWRDIEQVNSKHVLQIKKLFERHLCAGQEDSMHAFSSTTKGSSPLFDDTDWDASALDGDEVPGVKHSSRSVLHIPSRMESAEEEDEVQGLNRFVPWEHEPEPSFQSVSVLETPVDSGLRYAYLSSGEIGTKASRDSSNSMIPSNSMVRTASKKKTKMVASVSMPASRVSAKSGNRSEDDLSVVGVSSDIYGDKQASFIDDVIDKTRSAAMSISQEIEEEEEEVEWRRSFRKKAKAWVRGKTFGFACAFVIVVDMIYRGVQTQVIMSDEFKRISHEIVAQKHWFIGELSFFICYFLEIFVRIVVQPRHFVKRHVRVWNFFDLGLVLLCAADIILYSFEVDEPSLRIIVVMFRNMRLMRVLRLIRLANSCSVIRHLRTMIYALVSLASSFVPAIVVFTLVAYIFSLLFMQGVTSYLVDLPLHSSESSIVNTMRRYYGSLHNSMWTLLAVITGGIDWMEVRSSVDEMGSAYTVLFLLYIILAHFGILNIFSGVFVNAAMQSIQLSRESQIDEAVLHRQNMAKQLVDLFVKSPTFQRSKHWSNEGALLLRWEQVASALDDEAIKAYFLLLELDLASLRKIFNIIDKRRIGEVKLADFVRACLNMKGAAKMVDIQLLQRGNKKLLEVVVGLRNDLFHALDIRETSELSDRNSSASIIDGRPSDAALYASEEQQMLEDPCWWQGVLSKASSKGHGKKSFPAT